MVISVQVCFNYATKIFKIHSLDTIQKGISKIAVWNFFTCEWCAASMYVNYHLSAGEYTHETLISPCQIKNQSHTHLEGSHRRVKPVLNKEGTMHKRWKNLIMLMTSNFRDFELLNLFHV